MSEICEVLKLYVESGHIEEMFMLGSLNPDGKTPLVYGIRLKKEKRGSRPKLLILRYCPACGTPQNFDAGEPIGMFCKDAGIGIAFTEHAGAEA